MSVESEPNDAVLVTVWAASTWSVVSRHARPRDPRHNCRDRGADVGQPQVVRYYLTLAQNDAIVREVLNQASVCTETQKNVNWGL
jgi:hypothetical protein